ncbi:hypothetical protein M8J75_015191 [Diaphorina citri]|nr:hypothetical protein M8J75_015191 [Diaphorina citri]
MRYLSSFLNFRNPVYWYSSDEAPPVPTNVLSLRSTHVKSCNSQHVQEVITPVACVLVDQSHPHVPQHLPVLLQTQQRTHQLLPTLW